jgi:acyl carrier protein
VNRRHPAATGTRQPSPPWPRHGTSGHRGPPDVLATVKAIIAEQTGYTTDMLEDELDLEADLGIDTVKQVEIFGKVSENFGLDVPEDLKLRDLNTIAKLADYLGRQIPAAAGTPTEQPVAAHPVRPQRGRPRCPGHGQGHHRRADRLHHRHARRRTRPGSRSRHRHRQTGGNLRQGLRKLRSRSPRRSQTARPQHHRQAGDYLGRQRVAPAATPAPAAAAAPAATEGPDLLAAVKAIIAEQTGYTADMLEDELDLEADLGIDTVKQVEIFGKVSAHFGLDVPEDLRLNDLNTIAKIGDYLGRTRPWPTPPSTRRLSWRS